jgi:hypothetical protein
MKKSSLMQVEVTTQNQSEQLNQSKPVHGKVAVIFGGGRVTRNQVLDSIKPLGVNVSGSVVLLSAHYIPEEQPDLLIRQLAKFVSE